MIKTFYATALIYWFVLNSLILHEIVFDLSVTEVRSELYLDNLTRFYMMLRMLFHTLRTLRSLISPGNSNKTGNSRHMIYEGA